jgi:hypothetical protein
MMYYVAWNKGLIKAFFASKTPYGSMHMQQCNFVYAHNKRTTFYKPLFTKLKNTQHYS